ncbi:hypothetical protein, conserved [Leishmania tarentolae]|uniref:Uncharacterized protein n=1 Tax=Leishmania tarentolae TaxID=5689 RepID=A0A640KJA8_LEITA|nr:hypothetical protein, conserved [Leishmania tarentolae]
MSMKSTRTTKGLVEAARQYLGEGTFAPDKAAELLQTAVQQEPTCVNALVLRSTLASRLGQLTSALADMSLAIELEKASNDLHRFASLYGARASLYYRMGRLADAVTDLRSALRLEPDNGMWCYELGRVHVKQGCVSLAQYCLQQALQEPMWSRVNETTRPKVYALYGRTCLRSRDYKKAKMLLKKSVEVGGEGPAAVLHDIGLAHYFEGVSLAPAVECLTRATEMDSRPVEYPMHLSLALVRKNQYAEALLSMNDAVLRGQEDYRPLFYRGCIEMELGMGSHALLDLQASKAMAAARKASSATALQRTEALVRVATGLTHIFCDKDLRSAAASLESKALQQTGEVSIRLYAGVLLGIARHEQGDLQGALRALHNTLQVLRKTAHTHSSGRGDGGRPSLMSELPVCAADVEVLALTHLGLVYSDHGYTDLAARHFREAHKRSAYYHRDTAQRDICFFRLAVSEAELKDYFGALQTLQSRPFCEGGASIRSAGLPSPPLADSSQISSTPTEVTDAEKPNTESSVEQAKEEPLTGKSTRTFNAATYHVLPGDVEHLHAVILRRLGRLELALSWATAAIVAAQSATDQSSLSASLSVRQSVPAFFYNRALIFFSLARYAEALTDVQECIRACNDVERAVTLGAEAADPYYLEGRIHHSLGAHGAALESLTEALRRNSSLQRTPPFAYAYGVLLAIAGRLNEALAAFTAAITAHNEGSAAEAPERGAEPSVRGDETERAPLVYHHERAKIYQLLGNYADALRDYNIVLGRAPGAPPAAPPAGAISTVTCLSAWSALVNRALTLKELKRYDEAAMDWDAALRSDRSGLLATFTSHDVYELPYIHLCLPGEELAAVAVVEPV